jgi:hypothetical protein
MLLRISLKRNDVDISVIYQDTGVFVKVRLEYSRSKSIGNWNPYKIGKIKGFWQN